MSRAARLGLVLMALIPPIASCGLVELRARTPHRFDPSAIPAELGRFRGGPSEVLPENARVLIAPDAYLLRPYAEPGAPPIWAYVGFYDGSGASGAHDPSVCYPAQGWDVVGQRELALDPGDGGTLHARLLAAAQGGREELVLYWFQPPQRWPAAQGGEPLAHALDRLAGRARYAFVRLSTRVDAREQSERERAEAGLAALGGALATSVRSAVQGAEAGAPTR